MTTLSIFDVHAPEAPLRSTQVANEIKDALERIGVSFERWKAEQALSAAAGQPEVLAAYARDIDRLKERGGYVTADVVRMHPEHPERSAMRAKFLAEHTHAEDEVRFFVEGAGAFYLREDERVYKVVCTEGDLISVPRSKRHWFDMGPAPRFTAIRLFIEPAGWIASFTGDTIADRIERFEAAG
jgi:1,2-dihydroxy-3-keto-5-methylthiopentene dioxygenase